MIWWIIFQVRTADSTYETLTDILHNEQQSAIEFLNLYYDSKFETIYDDYNANGEISLFRQIQNEPAFSGIQPGDRPGASLDDSLYLIMNFGGRDYFIFLNRRFPELFMSGNARFIYRPPAAGRLLSPRWLTAEMIIIDPAGQEHIYNEHDRHLRMMVMEGAFFFVLIIIGAYMIYSALRRARRMEREQILFVRSITHELKIPITSISLFLDTLRRHNYDSRMTAELVPKMKRDLGRLNGLIDNILQVRKLWEKKYRQSYQIVDLSEQLTRFTTDISERVEAAGGKMKSSIENNIRIKGAPDELIWIWETIFENCLKYAASPELVINVSLKSLDENAVIRIIDNGPGIESGSEEALFSQFSRGVSNSGRTIPGSGLGLYIAREYVSRMKGRINIGNADGGGCMVTLSFKKIS
jgi:signal transduction histidine kinase